MTLHDTMKELEELGCDMADNIKDNLINSKHGRLKLLGLEALPIITGATVGGIARATGNPEWIAIPPVLDLFFGALPSHSPRAVGRVLLGYAKYAFGAALPYADQIYIALQNLSDKV